MSRSLLVLLGVLLLLAGCMRSISDGVLSIVYPPDTFTLATSPDEIRAQSYIPPCDQGVAFCFFYTGPAYAGTNFESAGLGITRRVDLHGAEQCVHALPDGWSGLTPAVREGSGYTTSVFAPLGDAGAGHYAHEELYRLSVGPACYELRIRIGQSQFANYDPGTIKKFTDADESALLVQLHALLAQVSFADGRTIVFPEAPTTMVQP